jgi:formylglycine-generating enzyme required for sulfatase activity/uncharacterized caspase-like protein
MSRLASLLRVARRLLCCASFAMLCATAGTPAQAKRTALVVGVNAYENLKPEQQLQKAVNDARAVANALKDDGFKVILAENPKRNDFFRAWQRFLDSIEPGDVAALYFAGHGVEINEVKYLLTRDVPDANDGRDVMQGSGIRVADLTSRMAEQHAQVTIAIIDACRNSPYANKSGRRGMGVSRTLANREEAPKGTLVMMSAGAGQEALDSLSAADTNPNSVYTRTLLPLLREPGLEMTDLAKRVRSDVEALAGTVGHEQRPSFYHELSGNFYLVPAAPVAVAAARQAVDEAARAWSMTKDTTSVAVLEAFRREFRDTIYAEMARARLDELHARQSFAAAPPAAPVPQVRATPAPEPNPPAEQPAPVRKKPSAFEAAQAWVKVKDTRDPAALESFIRDYGDSIYVDQARTKLAEAKNDPAVAANNNPAGAASNPPPVTPPHDDSVAMNIPAAGGIASQSGKAFADRAKSPLTSAEEKRLLSGERFQECPTCPDMIVVPNGRFIMGSPDAELGRSGSEGPQHDVTIGKPFAVGRFAVTADEWKACLADGGCNGYEPKSDTQLRGRYPVTDVSWNDAQAYVAWLSKTTGRAYRLMSEAEREYVARAGTSTPFWWGASISPGEANYDARTIYAGGKPGEFRQKPVIVDSLAANAFGLYHIEGNVSEWVADCWHDDYKGAPSDGSAWVSGDCGRRVLRGGSWYDNPEKVRAASRSAFYPGFRSREIGFRVARDLAK